MPPQLLYETPHKIWKMAFDAQEGALLLEVRDESLRQGFLAAIDWASGELLWDEGYLEETWWFSLQQAAEGRVYVHLFSDEQRPEAQAVVCLSTRGGEGLWQRDGIRIEQMGKGALLARDSQWAHCWIDAQSGQNMSYTKLLPLQEKFPLLLPERYLEGQDEHFGTVAQLLQKKLGIQAKQAIDYWEGEEAMAIAYIVQQGIFFDTFLALFDMQGKVLHHSCLQRQGKGIGTAPFAWAAGHLFYVEEKARLLRLPVC